MLCAVGIVVLLIGVIFLRPHYSDLISFAFLGFQVLSFFLGLSTINEIQGKLAALLSVVVIVLVVFHLTINEPSRTTKRH